MGKHDRRRIAGSTRSYFLRGFLGVLVVGVIAILTLVAVVSLSPVTGTSGADFLRSIIGPQAVASLEGVVFTIQDTIHHTIFLLEGGKAAPPWQVSAVKAQAITPTQITEPLSTGTPGTIVDKSALNSPKITALPSGTTAMPTISPAQTPWLPAEVTPLGTIPDEGVWEQYILDASGDPVAYRTFLQPDSSRPYAIVAVVAFDLSKVQLHYQLGTQEPVSPVREPSNGDIPAIYRQPGVLLAAFNGAFKTIHGHYGVMVNGNTLVPMIDGMGTLVIYNDGSLRIGEWGSDLTYTPDMAVVRQNCPLMVIKGQVNPLVYNNSVSTWGGTITGAIVTFRSGIGLSQDGKTLYYFAGNYLSMPALATAMVAAGAYQAMQLDINNYYVLFTRFDVQNSQLKADPLLPKAMVDGLDRFLGSYSRDYFYVTTK